MRRLFSSLSLTVLVTLVSVRADVAAQDRAVMDWLVEHGRMSSRDARNLVRAISRVLASNAGERSDRYDRIRQAVGRAMFDGPGRTREEYEDRLRQVRERMRRGLDEQLLEALFPNRPNGAVLCANDFGVTVTDCDSLLAASSRTAAAIPYATPDDGRALGASLRAARVRGRQVTEITRAVRETMLGVPRTLARDARGRGLLRLLERCPGALTTRESQIRAWHVGPTEGMVRCLAQVTASGSTAAQATERAALLFGVSPAAAEAFIGWGAPELMAAAAGGTATAAATPPSRPPAAATPSSEDLLSQGRAHFRANRLRESAAAYEQVTRIDPTNPRAFAGLGSARLRMNDARRAAAAYRQAVALNPGNPSFHAFLGESLAASGDRAGAESEYRQALAIQPNNFIASAGLSRLGSQANQQASGAIQGAELPPEQAAERWRQAGREHFTARRYPQAAAAYEQATRLVATHAGAHAGLGAARLAMGDTAGAVSAYQSAVRIEPNRSAFWSALARAQAQSGDRDGAIAALQRSLQLDPNNTSARDGLAALGVAGATGTTPAATAGTTAGAPTQAAGQGLPEVPSRDQIIGVMRPLQQRVKGCAPGYVGRLTFSFTVTGETGAVTAATIAEEELVEPAEMECMIGVVQSATFARFARETLEISYPYML